MANKNYYIFGLLLFEATFTSLFKDENPKEVTKQ
jgi:hypothetical protein